MVFQGLSRRAGHRSVAAVLRLARAAQGFQVRDAAADRLALPARHFWDADYLRNTRPGRGRRRPSRRPARTRVLGRQPGRSGQVLHGYQSGMAAGNPARSQMSSDIGGRLVRKHPALGDVAALQQRPGRCACRCHRAGARHGHEPGVLDAFALAITGWRGCPRLSRHAGRPARSRCGPGATRPPSIMRCTRCCKPLREPGPMSQKAIISSRDWQTSFWGSNYPRLAGVKQPTTPTACFSCIMASAARTGATTALPASSPPERAPLGRWSGIALQRPLRPRCVMLRLRQQPAGGFRVLARPFRWAAKPSKWLNRHEIVMSCSHAEAAKRGHPVYHAPPHSSLYP